MENAEIQSTKPLSNEGIRKHLLMLAAYCQAQVKKDEALLHAIGTSVKSQTERRRKAFEETAKHLEKLANSRSVKTLFDYGE